MTQRERQILELIQRDPMISQQALAEALDITRSSVAVHISNLIKKGYIAGKGYVLQTGAYALVVGGVNVDIGGQSFSGLVRGDSNPGKVTISLGGVGRNIAHNMSLLGVQVRMLTAYGDDLYGRRIAASCNELGIDVSHARMIPGAATSTYLYIADPTGEMDIALSDMQICEGITPEYLEDNLPVIQNARVVVADANLPEETLTYLSQHRQSPLFCDPVSTKKAEKLIPILDKIHTLKPNRLEAELLTGISVNGREDAEKAAKALLQKGVKRVFLSMGAEGVYAADGKEGLWLSNLPGKMVSTTGCGDAFMGAIVWAYLEGMDLKTSALAGLAASSVAMETKQTINPELNPEEIISRMKI